jgi:hypothetical protein
MPGYEISNESQIIRDAFLDYTRYLVGMACLVQPLKDGKEHGDAHSQWMSGFVLEIGKRWYWTSAGHWLKDMKRDAEKGLISVREFRIADSFGKGAIDRTAIPFDFEGAAQVFVDQDGLDFAIVELGDLATRLLKKNNVKPVRPKDWLDSSSLRFESHFIAGLPADSKNEKIVRRRTGYSVLANPVPSFVHVKALKRPPKGRETRFPRFVGKVGEEDSVGNIAGMSGGPVIGIVKGFREHRIVALQSSWLSKERIIFGCPLEVFVPIAKRAIRKFRSRT